MDILDKRSCKSTLLQVIEVTAPSLRSNFDARLKKTRFLALMKKINEIGGALVKLYFSEGTNA